MAEVSMATKQEVARELHKNGLIKFGEFTLKSGIVSPFYIDLRQVQSFPDTLRVVTKAYGELLKDVDENVFLAGVPEAGTPLATAVGYEYRRPLLQPRKVVKDHGTKSSVEGAFTEGDRLVLLDDLITKGDSKLEAITQVTGAGLVLDRFIVLIDREQGGLDAIRSAGHPIDAAMTITDLLDILLAEEMLAKDQYDSIITFIRSN